MSFWPTKRLIGRRTTDVCDGRTTTPLPALASPHANDAPNGEWQFVTIDRLVARWNAALAQGQQEAEV